MNDFDNWYEEGYTTGWLEGRHIGYSEGYSDAVNDYEPRIRKLYAEMVTLNARIDFLANRKEA